MTCKLECGKGLRKCCSAGWRERVNYNGSCTGTGTHAHAGTFGRRIRFAVTENLIS
jgi:hypothetical protein